MIAGEDESAEVGVGPWEGETATDSRYDPELLAQGDRRNVVDRYRCCTPRRQPIPVTTRNRSRRVTGATSWTVTGIGRATPSSPIWTRVGTTSTSLSRTGSTTSTSAPSCATRTLFSPPR